MVFLLWISTLFELESGKSKSMLNNSFHRNLLLFMVIFIICIPADQASITDELCNSVHSILCVQDSLITISNVANNTGRLCHEIEKHILHTVGNRGTLNNYVKSEKTHLKAKLPTSPYHDNFFESNNINRVSFFISFFSFSILDIL